ncbi:unnamed protein product [Rhodiola kirilowii]
MAAAEEKNSSNKMSYLAVLVIRFLYAAMFILNKAAFDGGMNNNIFVFYRQTTATLFLLPITLFFGWKAMPQLSFRTFCQIFMLSLIGITLTLIFNGIGLADTSPTIVSAISNSIPVITFILAVLLRIELVKWRTKSGAAKIAGIVICLGGVATLAFYNGPSFRIFSHGWQLIKVPKVAHAVSQSGKTWIKGCFFLFASTVSWALWVVLQVRVLKHYPSKLHFTTFQCVLSSFQSFVIAIAFERRPAEWKLGWNLRLVTVAYSGIVVTGISYYLMSFVIEKKGPVFMSSTQPLELVFTIAASALLLGHAVSLGSIIGGLLLVGGLYSVLWGKYKEARSAENNAVLEVEKESYHLSP